MWHEQLRVLRTSALVDASSPSTASEEIVIEKKSDDANARRCHQLIAMRLEPEMVGPL